MPRTFEGLVERVPSFAPLSGTHHADHVQAVNDGFLAFIAGDFGLLYSRVPDTPWRLDYDAFHQTLHHLLTRVLKLDDPSLNALAWLHYLHDVGKAVRPGYEHVEDSARLAPSIIARELSHVSVGIRRATIDIIGNHILLGGLSLRETLPSSLISLAKPHRGLNGFIALSFTVLTIADASSYVDPFTRQIISRVRLTELAPFADLAQIRRYSRTWAHERLSFLSRTFDFAMGVGSVDQRIWQELDFEMALFSDATQKLIVDALTSGIHQFHLIFFAILLVPSGIQRAQFIRFLCEAATNSKATEVALVPRPGCSREDELREAADRISRNQDLAWKLEFDVTVVGRCLQLCLR